MTTITTDKSVRLRISGPALTLAWDPGAEEYSAERLNDHVKALQSGQNNPNSNAAPGDTDAVLTTLNRLGDRIDALSDMIDLQHAALLSIVASSGDENAKALTLMVRATDHLLSARTPSQDKNPRPLSDLMDRLRQKDFEEQRGLEAQSTADLDQSQKPMGREID